MSKRMKKAKDAVKVQGFFRLQITEDMDGQTKVVSDSGWNKNTVTNDGFNQFLCLTLAGMAGSKTVSHVALGTGTAPGATATTLDGEIMSSTQRLTVSPSTVSSKTAQFTAAFLSNNSFLSTTANIANIGLFNTSSGGTIFAGNTYASSSCATNQNVQVTYQIRFS